MAYGKWKLHSFNTIITWEIAVCSVQMELETLK